MIMAERPTFTARYGGFTYPVSSLTKDRLVVGGMEAGENPFSPNRIGDTIDLVLAAKRNGKAEKMTVKATIVDLWGGEATFSLPNGLSMPVPDTGDAEQPEPATYYTPNDTFTLPYAVPDEVVSHADSAACASSSATGARSAAASGSRACTGSSASPIAPSGCPCVYARVLGSRAAIRNARRWIRTHRRRFGPSLRQLRRVPAHI